MEFDPQRFRERQYQRQQQKQQRKAKQRRLILGLVIAGVILIVSVVAISLLTRKAVAENETAPSTVLTEPGSTDATADNTQPEVSADPTGPTEPPDTVIRIAAAGDLNITDNVVASGGSAMDYSKAFIDVAHLLGDADISVLNLEGSLVGEPYGSTYFSAPQSMMEVLDDAGLDLIQLANSYSIRNGMSGLAETIDGVRSAGMEPLGVYPSEAEFQRGGGYTIVSAQGVRIAFVAFTKGMDGMTLPSGNENCVNVLYTDYDSTYQNVNAEKIDAIMAAVENEKPDLVVAMLHWGSEFNDTISASQKRIYEHLQSWEVDAIIGTHSHYVQQMVYDAQKGTFIAYSLGDFFGDAQRSGSEYSVILELEVTKDGTTGLTAITGFDYTPIFTVVEKDRFLRVVRIRETMTAYENRYIDRVTPETYEKMKYALTRIEERIKGE